MHTLYPLNPQISPTHNAESAELLEEHPTFAFLLYQQHNPLRLFNNLTMRPLTETETQTLFSKLANYMGPSIKNLIAPPDANPSTDQTRMSFRLGNQNRVYYCSEYLANLSTCVARENLLSVGTCLGM